MPAYTGTAKLIRGTEVSEEIKERLRKEIMDLDVIPKLAIVQVGSREDSNVYVRAKVKFAQDVGCKAEIFNLPRSSTENEVIAQLDKLNNDNHIHGIIVQLPFDSENFISQDKITNLVSPDKDVDGLSDLNAGKLFHGQVQVDGDCFLPCTPYGCMELIRKAGAQVSGSNCVVIGRSKIVGNPMAQLLLHNNATVIVAHSRTKNTAELVRQADIVVVAVGVPELVKADWIKPGAVVIDCGITAIDDPTKKSGKRLVGDVAFHEVKNVASAITPVPGGVGPMTVAMLISNTVQAARRASSRKIKT